MSRFINNRILFISLRSDYGGGPTHMFDLVTGLNNTFEKYVACPVQKPFYNMYKEHEIKVFPLPVRTFSFYSFIKLIIFAKRNDINIIHSHGKGAGIYSRLLGVMTNRPVIHTFHGIHYHNYNYVMQKLYFFAERIMSAFTKHIINVSGAEHEEGLKLGLFPKSKAMVIYNGVNLAAIQKSPIEIELNNTINSIKKDNILICTVARFDFVKGIDVAIQAIKCLREYRKNFKYILIGDGELREEITMQIAACDVNKQILLLGFRDNVPGILKKMDIYLSPSRSESMSMTLLEAMSCGLPIVATDIPGNRDLVKRGLLAKVENPQDIARKLNRLIGSSRLRNKLADEGVALVDNSYTLKRMICDTETLYYKVLTTKKTSPTRKDSSDERRIRVGINASKYSDINTGVGRYTFNLCKSISKANGIFCCFYAPGRKPNTLVIDRSGIHDSRIIIQNNSLRILWEQVVLPIYAWKDRLDIVHYTDHALSLLHKARPNIITVHDIAYIRFPGLLNKSRRIYKKNILKISIKNADIIIADSYSTKRDIIEFFRIKEEKIRVVHLGVESRFCPISNVEEYRLRNNLPSKIILNVGTLEPRKNVVSLISAFKKLKAKGFDDYKLVIAGAKGWLYEQIFEEATLGNIEKEILFLGVVSDQDLPMLYNCAEMFVYPSLYEGFGLPPLEAMACGVPVITSNTSSLPEVVGDAGIMVDPNDVNSLCDNMYNLLKDKEMWKQMSKKGLQRSKLFSWDKAAQKILKIYDEVFLNNK